MACMEYTLGIRRLLQVKELLATPERLNMEDWRTQVTVDGGYVCGTVCCIAGHGFELAGIELLSRTHRTNLKLGAEVFGLPKDEAAMLFWFPFSYLDLRWAVDHGLSDGITITPKGFHDAYGDLRAEISRYKTGSIEYARVVARAIDRCISRSACGEGISRSAVPEEEGSFVSC